MESAEMGGKREGSTNARRNEETQDKVDLKIPRTTAGVAASAASLRPVPGSMPRPSICQEGVKKIEKVVQNGAF